MLDASVRFRSFGEWEFRGDGHVQFGLLYRTIQTFKFASPDFGVVCNDFEPTAFSGDRINAVRIRKPATRA